MTVNIKRAIAVFTAVSFLFPSVVTPSLEATSAGNPFSSLSRDVSCIGTLPERLGAVTDAWKAGPRRVYIIQDLHCHPGVQRNIREILDHLRARAPESRIFVEGAAGGRVDTSWVECIRDKGSRQGFIESLLAAGRLSGAEYYAMTRNCAGSLFGLDETALHRDNLKRLRILRESNDIDTSLETMDKELIRAEELYLKGPLRRFVRRMRKGKNAPRTYYVRLIREAKKAGINVEWYPYLASYAGMLKSIRRIDETAVRRELAALASELRAKMPYAEYRSLSGAGNDARYTDVLARRWTELSSRYSLNGKYTHLKTYLAVCNARHLDPEKLFDEEHRLKREMIRQLAARDCEYTIAMLRDCFESCRAWWKGGIDPRELDYVRAHEREFEENWIRYAGSESYLKLEPFRETARAYYRVNEERTGVFFSKIASGISDGGPSAAIAVMGGFHTGDLAKRLREAGISYYIITPGVDGGLAAAEQNYRRMIHEQGITRISADETPEKQVRLLACYYVPQLLARGMRSGQLDTALAEGIKELCRQRGLSLDQAVFRVVHTDYRRCEAELTINGRSETIEYRAGSKGAWHAKEEDPGFFLSGKERGGIPEDLRSAAFGHNITQLLRYALRGIPAYSIALQWSRYLGGLFDGNIVDDEKYDRLKSEIMNDPGLPLDEVIIIANPELVYGDAWCLARYSMRLGGRRVLHLHQALADVLLYMKPDERARAITALLRHEQREFNALHIIRSPEYERFEDFLRNFPGTSKEYLPPDNYHRYLERSSETDGAYRQEQAWLKAIGLYARSSWLYNELKKETRRDKKKIPRGYQEKLAQILSDRGAADRIAHFTDRQIGLMYVSGFIDTEQRDALRSRSAKQLGELSLSGKLKLRNTVRMHAHGILRYPPPVRKILGENYLSEDFLGFITRRYGADVERGWQILVEDLNRRRRRAAKGEDKSAALSRRIKAAKNGREGLNTEENFRNTISALTAEGLRKEEKLEMIRASGLAMGVITGRNLSPSQRLLRQRIFDILVRYWFEDTSEAWTAAGILVRLEYGSLAMLAAMETVDRDIVCDIAFGEHRKIASLPPGRKGWLATKVYEIVRSGNGMPSARKFALRDQMLSSEAVDAIAEWSGRDSAGVIQAVMRNPDDYLNELAGMPPEDTLPGILASRMPAGKKPVKSLAMVLNEIAKAPDMLMAVDIVRRSGLPTGTTPGNLSLKARRTQSVLAGMLFSGALKEAKNRRELADETAERLVRMKEGSLAILVAFGILERRTALDIARDQAEAIEGYSKNSTRVFSEIISKIYVPSPPIREEAGDGAYMSILSPQHLFSEEAAEMLTDLYHVIPGDLMRLLFVRGSDYLEVLEQYKRSYEAHGDVLSASELMNIYLGDAERVEQRIQEALGRKTVDNEAPREELTSGQIVEWISKKVSLQDAAAQKESREVSALKNALEQFQAVDEEDPDEAVFRKIRIIEEHGLAFGSNDLGSADLTIVLTGILSAGGTFAEWMAYRLGQRLSRLRPGSLAMMAAFGILDAGAALAIAKEDIAELAAYYADAGKGFRQGLFRAVVSHRSAAEIARIMNGSAEGSYFWKHLLPGDAPRLFSARFGIEPALVERLMSNRPDRYMECFRWVRDTLEKNEGRIPADGISGQGRKADIFAVTEPEKGEGKRGPVPPRDENTRKLADIMPALADPSIKTAAKIQLIMDNKLPLGSQRRRWPQLQKALEEAFISSGFSRDTAALHRLAFRLSMLGQGSLALMVVYRVLDGRTALDIAAKNINAVNDYDTNTKRKVVKNLLDAKSSYDEPRDEDSGEDGVRETLVFWKHLLPWDGVRDIAAIYGVPPRSLAAEMIGSMTTYLQRLAEQEPRPAGKSRKRMATAAPAPPEAGRLRVLLETFDAKDRAIEGLEEKTRVRVETVSGSGLPFGIIRGAPSLAHAEFENALKERIVPAMGTAEEARSQKQAEKAVHRLCRMKPGNLLFLAVFDGLTVKAALAVALSDTSLLSGLGEKDISSLTRVLEKIVSGYYAGSISTFEHMYYGRLLLDAGKGAYGGPVPGKPGGADHNKVFLAVAGLYDTGVFPDLSGVIGRTTALLIVPGKKSSIGARATPLFAVPVAMEGHEHPYMAEVYPAKIRGPGNREVPALFVVIPQAHFLSGPERELMFGSASSEVCRRIQQEPRIRALLRGAEIPVGDSDSVEVLDPSVEQNASAETDDAERIEKSIADALKPRGRGIEDILKAG